ncbi:hypothetical protein L6452_40756 [Arctium lappa]|uniref:Uncharacterized protein n=1 Tax=Arctium lappa TaxID=4217 RepID=A0ACB8XNC9_ARCLA|nr:hypothetical protein L6452_40756 [Arctium lappa]
MTITKSTPRKRSHAKMKGAESSSENSPNKQSTPSKKIAKEKQSPMKRFTRFKTKPTTEDEGSAIALSEDLREKNSKEVDYEAVVSKLSTTTLDALAAVAEAQVQMPEAITVQTMTIPTESISVSINPFPIEAPIIPETPIPTPLTPPIRTPLNSPLITPVATPKVTKTTPLVSPSKILDDTLSELLGINLTPKHQEKQYVNPIPPTHHQLVDETSKETQEPSPIASQNTEPLGTPVNNPSVNMVVDSPVDEDPPQFSPRMVELSPSMSHVSPVHTATTPPTAGYAQDDDEEVDMTRVRRRTMYKKKLKDKKRKRPAKEAEVVEDTEVEEISPPKRITR